MGTETIPNLDECDIAIQDLSMPSTFINFSYSRVKTPLAL